MMFPFAERGGKLNREVGWGRPYIRPEVFDDFYRQGACHRGLTIYAPLFRPLTEWRLCPGGTGGICWGPIDECRKPHWIGGQRWARFVDVVEYVTGYNVVRDRYLDVRVEAAFRSRGCGGQTIYFVRDIAIATHASRHRQCYRCSQRIRVSRGLSVHLRGREVRGIACCSDECTSIVERRLEKGYSKQFLRLWSERKCLQTAKKLLRRVQKLLSHRRPSARKSQSRGSVRREILSDSRQPSPSMSF